MDLDVMAGIAICVLVCIALMLVIVAMINIMFAHAESLLIGNKVCVFWKENSFKNVSLEPHGKMITECITAVSPSFPIISNNTK